MKYEIEAIVCEDGTTFLTIYKEGGEGNSTELFAERVDSVETALAIINTAIRGDRK